MVYEIPQELEESNRDSAEAIMSFAEE